MVILFATHTVSSIQCIQKTFRARNYVYYVSPHNPGVDAEAFRQARVVVVDDVALGAHPEPVSPARPEAVARTERVPSAEHWGKERRKEGRRKEGREGERGNTCR